MSGRLKFVKKYLEGGILGAVSLSCLFLPFGVLFWFQDGEPSGFVALLLIGGVIGFLMGIGNASRELNVLRANRAVFMTTRRLADTVRAKLLSRTLLGKSSNIANQERQIRPFDLFDNPTASVLLGVGPLPFSVSQRVGDYHLIEGIGHGGMGVVFKARQVGTDRIVALKMILNGPFAGPEELARFRREAEAIARLEHPNIVKIHEVGEWENVPYFSLEFVEGGNLAQKIKGKRHSPRDAAEILQTVASAVSHAHERGIIHRDLKPGNILLTAGGAPKVADFGLVKELPKAPDFNHTISIPEGWLHGLAIAAQLTPRALRASNLATIQTGNGVVLGTPSYMAPEQAAGDIDRIDERTDVYSLGGILYELLTGQPPFRGKSAAEIVERVLNSECVRPTLRQPSVPEQLENICLRCLRREPSQRYASAVALVEDLRNFLVN